MYRSLKAIVVHVSITRAFTSYKLCMGYTCHGVRTVPALTPYKGRISHAVCREEPTCIVLPYGDWGCPYIRAPQK